MESPVMVNNYANNYMASEYQGDAMQYRNKPYKVTVESTSGNLFLEDDCVPKTYRPAPMSASDISYSFEGDIFVTPDKGKSHNVQTLEYSNARRTVTFNDNIDIQLMSPGSSICIANSSNETYNSSDNSGESCGRVKYEQIQRQQHDVSDSIESSIETIDIFASDKGIPCLGTLDHTESELARPEFSSIISLTKQRIRVENDTLDVSNAVRDKLNIAKTRAKVEERAYSHLNRDEQQYRQLQSTEITEDAVVKTEQILSSRVQRTSKPDKKISKRDPDIMDFFKDDFQKETGSYSIETFTKQHSQPEISDPENAFDVYQYVRSWEGW